MGSNRIATMERSGLTVSQVGGNDVYKMLAQVRSIVEFGKLGTDYVSLFAEPVDCGHTIDWYADEDGDAVCVSALPPEEKQNILSRFREMLETLQDYAGELRSQNRSQTYKTYADILEKAVVVPGLECLYSLAGKPVLVGWGFSKGDNNTVEEGKKLIKEIEKNLKEAVPATQQAKQKAVAPFPAEEKAAEEQKAAAEPIKEEAAEAPQPQVGVSETPVAEAPPTRIIEAPRTPVTHEPLPKKKPSRIIPIVIGTLIGLACAFALWAFLQSRADNSFAFLKGERAIAGVLANENNEMVDLKLNFPGEDGKGESFIVEPTQTCKGTVTAQHSPNNEVTLTLSEQTCPNGNHYPAFSLICAEGESSCTGINPDGDSWHVDVNIGGSAQ